MHNIYDSIYERICSLLTEEKITELRRVLHSIMNQHDLAAFCTDRSKLSLVSYNAAHDAHGPVRAFRSTVFCVRLLIFVESNTKDTDVGQLQITAEIQDGGRNEVRVLVTA